MTTERPSRLGFAGLLLLAFSLFTPLAGAEAGLAMPSGPVILKVSGDIEHTNRDRMAVFDREMIEALGMETLVSETPWSEGMVTFEGIYGRRLLEALGRHGPRILASAINDYSVEIPVEDLEVNGLFFALKMNGRYLRARDKGPIWAIYPFSARPELNDALFHNRAIWQLDRLEFN
jgi:hypothetical protein